MDDNIISPLQPPAADNGTSGAQPQDQSENSASVSEKVFDITPDLNMAPISETAAVADIAQTAVPTTSTSTDTFSSTGPAPLTLADILPGESADTLRTLGLDPATAKRASAPNPPIQKVTAQAPRPSIATPTPTPAPNTTPITQDPTSLPNPSTKTINSTVSEVPLPQGKFSGIAPDREGNLGLKRLRTYESDIAELMSRRHTSTASIAIAEQKRETGSEVLATTEEPKVPRHTVRNILVALASLLLICGGALAGYYLYTHSLLYIASGTPTSQPATQIVPAVIPADVQTIIHVDNASALQVLQLIRAEIAKNQKFGTIMEIIPVETTNKTTLRISGPDMVKLMNVTAPDILTRSLTDTWMLGVYTDPSGNKNTFVIVTNNFFQNAFAGVLQWEQTMANDIKPFIPSVADVPSVHGKFIDRIIMNKDVREFITDDGNILFLYSFIDNSKLVIANNEATLTEILTRLEKQTFVR